jgi:membrane protease YdiL (CAAX protease family)
MILWRIYRFVTFIVYVIILLAMIFSGVLLVIDPGFKNELSCAEIIRGFILTVISIIALWFLIRTWKISFNATGNKLHPTKPVFKWQIQLNIAGAVLFLAACIADFFMFPVNGPPEWPDILIISFLIFGFAVLQIAYSLKVRKSYKG